MISSVGFRKATFAGGERMQAPTAVISRSLQTTLGGVAMLWKYSMLRSWDTCSNGNQEQVSIK